MRTLHLIRLACAVVLLGCQAAPPRDRGGGADTDTETETDVDTDVFRGFESVPLALGDFNGDGVGDARVGPETYLGNDGDGPVPAPTATPFIQVAASGADYPAAIAGAFDGDGIADLALLNGGDSHLYVYFGAAADPWTDPLVSFDNYSLGGHPSALARGDFDGDGIADLAVADRASDTVRLLIGEAYGTFEEGAILAVGDAPQSIAAHDFDGDGIFDLAVAHALSDDVAILLGDGASGAGDGTFLPPVFLPVAAHPEAIAAGDLDGDGVVDLAVLSTKLSQEDDYGDADRSSGIGALRGRGDGTFDAWSTFSCPGAAGGDSQYNSMAIGDLDADGVGDLLCASTAWMGGDAHNGWEDAYSEIGIAFGDGAAAKLLVASVLNTDSSTGALAVGAADFDGDGALDVIAGSTGGIGVARWAGAGGGSVETPVQSPTSWFPGAMTTADFDGDGAPDLAICGGELAPDPGVIILLGGVGGGFAEAASYAVGGLAKSILADDFDDDGIADLAVATAANAVDILLGNGADGVGDGSFAPPVTYDVQAPGWGTPMRAADFTGDGVTDLAVGTSSAVKILVGNGAGGIGDGSFTLGSSNGAGGVWPVSLAVSDFDTDGVLDLAVANRDATCAAAVLLGNGPDGAGDGTFAAPDCIMDEGDSYGIAASDFDGDGIVDLVLSNDSTSCGGLCAFRGSGAGGVGYGTFVYIPAANSYPIAAGEIAVGDFDGDGRDDVAVAQLGYGWSAPSSIGVLPSTGSPTPMLRNGAWYTVALGARAPIAADFDGDGVPDIAVGGLVDSAPESNVFDPAVSVLLGRGADGVGDGTFRGFGYTPN